MPATATQLRQASPLDKTRTDSDVSSIATTLTTATSSDGRTVSTAAAAATSSQARTAMLCRVNSTASGDSAHVHGPECARVLLHDQELWKRAADTKAAIDFRSLTDLSVSQWKWKASSNRFTLFQRQVENREHPAIVRSMAHEVLSAGEIRCSVAELAHILRSSSEVDYNAVMRGLYKKDFIYGSSVHVVPADSASLGSISSSVSSTSSHSQCDDEQLTVKTSTFVRSNLLNKNEQWCYLEYFKRKELREGGGDGFTVTISSLHEDELRTGKANDRERVNDMHDVVAGYLVEKVPNENLMRVLFYGQYNDINGDLKGKASSSMMKSRLAFLAKGATQLPNVVRRRRLGAQTFADRAAFVAKNTRCICCTKSLHLFSKKKRCYLCGYFVCDKDWSIQNVETRAGQLSTVRVCARCLETVECCDYSQVSPRTLGAPRIQPNPPNLPSPSTAMATFLQDALRSAASECKKKSAVKSVIKHLVGHEVERARTGSSSFAAAALTDQSGESEYHAALDAYLKVDAIPLDQCVLANAEARKYSIDMPANPAEAVPHYPLAENEAERLATIERNHIDKIGNADEFNIIASLAARELNCYASLITVITEESQLVLGANLEDLQKLDVSRSHAFCAHTILDDKPLVLPHPEADVRFQNYIPVKHLGAKFYCGFPIVSVDNTVVGSVCCIDMQTHELTQAQYAAMTKLAATASKVLQLKGQEIESRATSSLKHL
ncbi:hypothetical protein Gpo141_00013093 [Globisporangium polare]